MPLTQNDQTKIVNAHNAYRLDPTINVPWIEWSSDLATGAQQWADNLATNVHTLQHSVAGTSRPANTGENIAAAARLPGSSPTDPAQMVDQWGKTAGMDANGNPTPSEQQNFKPGIFNNISTTGNWADAGHYSQVIWRKTTAVGCGFATDNTPDSNGFIWDYLVGRYSPAGNVSGQGVPFPASTLPYVSCGSSTNIWRVDKDFTLSQYQPSSKIWTKITASDPIKQVSAGSDGMVWVVTRNNQIAKYANNAWGGLPGGYFTQVSVATATLAWGANKNDDVWQFNTDGSGWTQRAASTRPIKQVSVATDGTVCGVDPTGVICQYSVANNNWTPLPSDPGNPSYFAQVAVGSASLIWGVNASNDVYQYNASSTSWTQIAAGSKMTQVSIAADGTICGVSATGVISQYANNTWTSLGS